MSAQFTFTDGYILPGATLTPAITGSPASAQLDAILRLQTAADYADRSLALSADQAAGHVPVLAANPLRKSLMIVPPAACTLLIGPDGQTGYPLLGLTPNALVTPLCPANAIYLRDLAAGANVTIWEG